MRKSCSQVVSLISIEAWVATGLPMTNDAYIGVDVGGSPWGTQFDINRPCSAPF